MPAATDSGSGLGAEEGVRVRTHQSRGPICPATGLAQCDCQEQTQEILGEEGDTCRKKAGRQKREPRQRKGG